MQINNEVRAVTFQNQRNDLLSVIAQKLDEIATLNGIIAAQAAEIEALKTAAPLVDADNIQDRTELR